MPVMFTGRTGRFAALIVVPAVRLSPGFENDTLCSVGLASNGVLVAPLYMSFPWIRSNMIPNPARTTVFPVPKTSYASPIRGPKFFHVLLTSPFGTPFTPPIPIPFS